MRKTYCHKDKKKHACTNKASTCRGRGNIVSLILPSAELNNIFKKRKKNQIYKIRLQITNITIAFSLRL